MKITQEEKVLVAVTKKEEPPRARGTAVFPYVSMMDALVAPICQHRLVLLSL